MDSNLHMVRADVISSQLLFGNNVKPSASISPSLTNRWSSDCSISLIGRNKTKWMERNTFMIDGFEKRMDYYVDFGDGQCKRVLSRKFHYQYDKSGVFNMRLYIKAGDNMIPVCAHKIEVENMSLSATLRSISLF